MDVKQEPLDSHEGVIKTEPGSDREPQHFKNVPNCAFGELNKNFEYQTTGQFVNIDGIKKEIAEIEEVKIEHDYLCENVPNLPIAFKTEVCEVKASSMFVDNSDIMFKPVFSEYADVQPKSENELLSTHCDLPTLKNESIDYPDYFIQPLRENSTKDVSKKKRKYYPCPVCQKNLPSSKSRSKHFGEHFGNRYVICEFCGKLMTKHNFLWHYFIHLVNNRTRKRSLKTNDVCSTHQLFECDICSKQLKRKHNLQLHLDIHNNEKPFRCDICSKTFKRKYGLRQHLVSHSTETPFKCNICSKEFKLKCTLMGHLVVHSNEKPFECDICFRVFKRKLNLNEHVLIHIEKSFQCNICLKKFNQKRGLHQHIKIHTVEKPFKCDFCVKQFTRNYNLQTHLKIHANGNSL